LEASFSHWGVYPRSLHGLKGIITAPFIHGSFNHLINNSVPLFTLTMGLLYFYKKIAYRLLLVFWLVTGILIWLLARPSYHIGASGVVYALATFIFFSGIIRKNVNLLALSLLVAFLYGSMVWGVFPIKIGVSWEAHLFGALTGLVCSILYRNQGPPPQKPSWMMQEEDDDEDEGDEDNDDDNNAYWKIDKGNTNIS